MSELKLRSFQERAIQQIQSAPLNRWLLNFDTGLGKTATALAAARRLGHEKILIATPAIVRNQWREEADRWWPGHPELGLITLGKSRKTGVSKAAAAIRDQAYAAPIQVVSYALIDQVRRDGWDCIIFDELHRLKGPTSQCSTVARQLVAANPRAAVLGLTATLMPDDVADAWNPLDIIWRGRFGKWAGKKNPSWAFCERYCDKVENEYAAQGYSYKGINPLNAAELAYRLSQISTRVTKEEVADELPPFLVTLQKVESNLQFSSLEDWLEKQGTEKLPSVMEWAEDAQTRTSHICILTHLKETAYTIANKLGSEASVITGDDSPEVRNKILNRVKQEKRGVVVATMHSVGIGIDLGFCSEVLFAELYWRPETVLQALGRFDGFRTRRPASATILCLANTADERMAKTLFGKIEAIGKAVKTGDSADKLSSALDSLRMSDDEAIALLNAALRGE